MQRIERCISVAFSNTDSDEMQAVVEMQAMYTFLREHVDLAQPYKVTWKAIFNGERLVNGHKVMCEGWRICGGIQISGAEGAEKGVTNSPKEATICREFQCFCLKIGQIANFFSHLCKSLNH